MRGLYLGFSIPAGTSNWRLASGRTRSASVVVKTTLTCAGATSIVNGEAQSATDVCVGCRVATLERLSRLKKNVCRGWGGQKIKFLSAIGDEAAGDASNQKFLDRRVSLAEEAPLRGACVRLCGQWQGLFRKADSFCWAVG